MAQKEFAHSSDYSDPVRIQHVRNRCQEFLRGLKNSENDEERKRYKEMLEYLGFFETVGLMVRRGYIPLRDMVQMYNGPILSLDIFFANHIEDVQQEAHMPAGLYENAFYLVKWAQRHGNRWAVRWLLL